MKAATVMLYSAALALLAGCATPSPERVTVCVYNRDGQLIGKRAKWAWARERGPHLWVTVIDGESRVDHFTVVPIKHKEAK